MPVILFARPQASARHRVQGIIGVSPVSRFLPRATLRSKRRILPAEPFPRFQPAIQQHRRDAYDTLRSVSSVTHVTEPKVKSLSSLGNRSAIVPQSSSSSVPFSDEETKIRYRSIEAPSRSHHGNR
jgi:hypothetical protein